MDRSRSQPLFDDTDRAIIDCLREDGRMPSSTIAQRVGVSEKTVRRRLQQLTEERGLKLAPVIDPDLIGLSTCLYVGLTVESSRMEEVAARVRTMPEVRYLAFTTGPWDLLAEAFVGSREHMADFLIKNIGQLPGVTKTETFNVIQIAKFGYEWEIPHVTAAPPPAVSIAHPQYQTPRPATPRYRAG
ncbi:Lrp/AsnC family transcriptional regulator [Paenarthrobacter sp. NPDC089714]|uniref:Lrp/AsnC family transcriptional regulator n=1 Tax=Paenarthrobacter sp. NPDC089714 TaxID=3364377 RepID=UPI00380A5B0F